MRISRFLSLASTAGLVLVGACNSDNNDSELTSDQGVALGVSIANQLNSVTSSFTAADFTATNLELRFD